MFFVFIFLISFPPDWENIEKALILENEDTNGSVEIYKRLEKIPGQVGIFANYRLIILDKENSYKWFLNFLKKNPKKNILQKSFEVLVESEDKKAVDNFEKFKNKFSIKFRKKIEQKILLIRYKNSKDKISILKEALTKNERAALSISKMAYRDGIKIPDKFLKNLFQVGIKFRDLEFCQKIMEEDFKENNLNEDEIFLLGRFYFFKGDHKKSFEYFNLLKDEKALFHKARVLLFLNEEEKAIDVLNNIKNNLFSEARYLISRIYLKNGKLEEAKGIIKNIKKLSIKNQAILNLAIHYSFYGKKEEALNLLNNLKENNEVRFWKQRIKDEIDLKINPQYAPFNFFYLSKLPDLKKSDLVLDFKLKPENFPQFLISKGYFEEGLLFSQTLKLPPKDIAKIYMKQKKYRDAINLIFPEAANIMKVDPGQWNSEILKIYYPKAYEEIAKKLCKESGIPLNLFWAMMRQESMFEEDATSSEGALGVMQVLPQNYLRYEEDLENALELEKNMRVSIKYLEELKRIFGDWVYVVAAYNAGEEAVSLWLKDPVTVDLPSFYSTIPYNETKKYLRNVLYNWMVYKILYGDENENL